MMEMSESIDKLAESLSKAQGSITGALKDSANPFFKSKYADLASCWEVARGPLSANGLAVMQPVSVDGEGVKITTLLAHSSGQWIRDTLLLMPKDQSPQAIGSCITYGRRYSFAAIVGIAQVDDDGNAASGKGAPDNSGRPDISPVANDPRVMHYAARFREAMDADVDEAVKGRMVFEIHDELIKLKDEYKNELYQAAASELPTNYRNAIKTYIAQYKRAGAA